jgi:hypothetical protein
MWSVLHVFRARAGAAATGWLFFPNLIHARVCSRALFFLSDSSSNQAVKCQEGDSLSANDVLIRPIPSRSLGADRQLVLTPYRTCLLHVQFPLTKEVLEQVRVLFRQVVNLPGIHRHVVQLPFPIRTAASSGSNVKDLPLATPQGYKQDSAQITARMGGM